MSIRLERTAYHEAGHAVIAWRLGRRFLYVTIKPDDKTFGHVRHKREGRRRPDFNRGGHERVTERDIIRILAGPEAEHLFSGHRSGARGGDYSNAVKVAESRFLGDYDYEEIELYLKWARHRARRMLSTPFIWRAVEALARELLTKDTIRYNEAAEIIRQAICAGADTAIRRKEQSNGK